jgi:hypothetical protein
MQSETNSTAEAAMPAKSEKYTALIIGSNGVEPMAPRHNKTGRHIPSTAPIQATNHSRAGDSLVENQRRMLNNPKTAPGIPRPRRKPREDVAKDDIV